MDLAHAAQTAVSEAVILLHPPLPLVGVSKGVGRGCQQNDRLADGSRHKLSKSEMHELLLLFLLMTISFIGASPWTQTQHATPAVLHELVS